MRELDVAPGRPWAVGRDARGYISDYKRPAADIYRVNTSTGERTLIAEEPAHRRQRPRHLARRQHFLYWKDNKFQAYDLDAGDDARRSAARAPVELRRRRVRSSGPEAVVRHRRLHERRQGGHRPRTGTTCGCCRSTARRRRTSRTASGTKSEIRFRYVRIEPDSTAPAAPGRRWRRRGGRGGARAARSISPSRSRSRRTASGRRRPASTSWRTAS